MSFQIYFLQDEFDAARFLDTLSELHAMVWTGTAVKSPSELTDDIKRQMSSHHCKYTIIPQTALNILQLNDGEAHMDSIGIEFLLCCKGNALSRTYEVGRFYYKQNENRNCNEQTLLLYGQLKKFVIKNYSFSRKAKIYIAPHFNQKYSENHLQATHLGRPITL